MTEAERRKVSVSQKPSKTHLMMVAEKVEGTLWFVLMEDDSELARSLSDSALGTWAFSQHGVREVRYHFDLSLGDMSR